ncbi:MAG: UDP-N-acetylglucosamine--N-acetylmuramyl-(pentapeptide) pyrophosphoryl-undecaprenol N-acetylglucosam [Parcubacteria bacterium C7867-001]|nr:MAG: UDP-N-acetylglucosamine--N-acetylmuramyl-(pentapeptide) pyrophosphoryl-undecaprenol N-acetylglucosam [Parcubacteria bacterium C7867-001]
MKIVLAGSGTGGHFYPLIAIAEAVHDLAREQRLIAPQLIHMAPKAFDEEALFENQISFVSIPAGKMRRYFSLQNVSDLFVTFIGFLMALVNLLRLYPDVVVSKGGYTSVPVVAAAHLLGIPVIIHESDVKAGRANLFAAPFAQRIAITFDETASSFPAKLRSRIARTGIPIRKAIAHPETEGAREELGLDTSVPTVLILGGSSGAKRINDMIVETLPELTQVANIIHQTGKDNFAEVGTMSKLTLEKSTSPSRYYPFPFLNTLSMRRSAGAADLVISRAGTTTIAEIALWRKPSIIIPIPETISHDQRTNAYAYAHTGAAIVLEEGNLTPHLFVSEVKRLLGDRALLASMADKSASFGGADAARIIAQEALTICLSHEK